MNGLRLAAYKLHSMHPSDRQWMLSRLSDHERDLVETELSALENQNFSNQLDFEDVLNVTMADQHQEELLEPEPTDNKTTPEENEPLDSLDASELSSFLNTFPQEALSVYLESYPDTAERYFNTVEKETYESIMELTKHNTVIKGAVKNVIREQVHLSFQSLRKSER